MEGKTTLKKHIYYWILPSAVTLSCILIYFLDLFGASHLIAPPINREFGVVENLQLLLLGAIFVITVKACRIHHEKKARRCFRILGLLTILLFLEEIDYGLHYWDYLNLPEENAPAVMAIDYSTTVRNIHNNGDILSITKMLSYAMIVILFVVFPLLPARIKDRSALIKYLSPNRLIITTAISLLIINNVALYFYRYYEYQNISLRANVSEFEEVMTYYIFMLYIAEQAYSNKLSLLFRHYRNRIAVRKHIASQHSGLADQ